MYTKTIFKKMKKIDFQSKQYLKKFKLSFLDKLYNIQD